MTLAAESSSAFRRLIAASDIEDAVLGQLQLWLASYLWEIERQHDPPPGRLAQPRGWVVSSGVDRFPEDQLPAIMIASPGTNEPPLADGAGVYTARFEVTVGCQIAAGEPRVALRLARLYAAAIRATLVQQQDLPGIDVVRVDWQGERYDRLETIDDRTICVGEVALAVVATDVTTRNAGPLEPIIGPQAGPDPDSPTWPRATSTDMAITKVEEER